MKKTFREHSVRLRSRTGVSPVRGADELDAPTGQARRLPHYFHVIFTL